MQVCLCVFPFEDTVYTNHGVKYIHIQTRANPQVEVQAV